MKVLRLLLAPLFLGFLSFLNAQEPEPSPIAPAKELFQKGDYKGCLEVLEELEVLAEEVRAVDALRIRCLQTIGEYHKAQDALTGSWPLQGTAEGRFIEYELLQDLGRFEEAKATLRWLTSRDRFQTVEDLLALGRSYLLVDAEPKLILDNFYKRAIEMEPENTATYLAIGDLALEKYDYALAAENFEKGLSFDGADPDLRFGMAQAFFPSDRPEALKFLEANLEQNPHHTDSLLLLAEHHLLAEYEDKSEAEELIDRAEAVNSKDYRIAAMRATIAQVKANEDGAQQLRSAALEGREGDPKIDHMIGRLLASQMRFAEAVPFLRRSLEIDPEFLPARIELGQNLLRLGVEDEAWALLESAHDRDGYNVAIYNLLSLHDKIQDYQMINKGRFIVRMEAKEVQLFGDRVIELLEQGERDLHAKYGFQPGQPILVEFFPEQEDFAVRTFGFLAGDGVLGACFGQVITMNSPNGRGAGKTNWESTLWHEYCHAVTLGASKNRIPRWLTEGISVYEERLRDPSCGERMTADYRQMILEGDELIPLGQLNYGFLRPKSGKHMMFAYYESSLFVEYFLAEFGEEKLRQIILDLRRGVAFSDACKERSKPLDELEKEFFAYAKERARAYGAEMDWTFPEEGFGEMDAEALKAWIEEHPKNYWGMQVLARRLQQDGLQDEAKEVLRAMIEAFPDQVEGNSPYRQLAAIHQTQGDHEAEAAMLAELVSRSTNTLDEMLRLIQLDSDAENWERLEKTSAQVMAINPYIVRASRARAESLDGLGQSEEALSAYQRLMLLEPPNPSQVRLKMAQLLRGNDLEQARRQVLEALAISPRYRDAHRLLLELQSESTTSPN